MYSAPLVVLVGGVRHVTLWRACTVLAQRHGATGWSLGRGRLQFSNSSGRVASYQCAAGAAPGELVLSLLHQD